MLITVLTQQSYLKTQTKPGLVVYACNPRTQEAWAIQQQPRLQKERTLDCGLFCWVLGELYVGWSGFLIIRHAQKDQITS